MTIPITESQAYKEREAKPVRVLDVGIGIGGSYILDDTSRGIVRTGVDINPQALETCDRKYGSPNLNLQTADVFVQSGEHLPFTDGSFDQVQFYYPHGTALYALITQTSVLWDELRRILAPGGSVHIISDVDSDNYRLVRTFTRRIHLQDPHENMAKAAQNSGFRVSFNFIPSSQAKEMAMTRYAKILGQSEQSKGSRIYYLQAQLNS